jgi:hypothetical protein
MVCYQLRACVCVCTLVNFRLDVQIQSRWRWTWSCSATNIPQYRSVLCNDRSVFQLVHVTLHCKGVFSYDYEWTRYDRTKQASADEWRHHVDIAYLTSSIDCSTATGLRPLMTIRVHCLYYMNWRIDNTMRILIKS